MEAVFKSLEEKIKFQDKFAFFSKGKEFDESIIQVSLTTGKVLATIPGVGLELVEFLPTSNGSTLYIWGMDSFWKSFIIKINVRSEQACLHQSHPNPSYMVGKWPVLISTPDGTIPEDIELTLSRDDKCLFICEETPNHR